MTDTTKVFVIDPRGKQIRKSIRLAPRRPLEALSDSSILLYDNLKLSSGCYREIFPHIKNRLAQRGIRRWESVQETIRGKFNREINALADDLVRLNTGAAIIALADMGVSPAMVRLTMALEKRGLPTVCLTASPGHELARAVAYYQAGNLCLCRLDIYQGIPSEEVRAAVDRRISEILEFLTAPADRIDAAARIRIGADDHLRESDGRIVLAEADAGDSPDEVAAGLDQAIERFESLQIGDGLPVIPPTPLRVDRMLAYWPGDPGEILFSGIGPSGAPVTVFDAAVSAVMAGCRPEYLPIVVTALKAMADSRYNLTQAVTTSHPGGNLLIVSGPLTRQIGLHGGQGCLGPGFRANATIGRAVNLVFINVCRAIPGISDLACLSSPAEYTYCFAEEPDVTPWETINAERFDAETTVVSVLKAEGPHAVMDLSSHTAEDLLETIVDCCTTLGSNNAYIPGCLVLVLTPDHARLLDRSGYTKARIRKHIFRHAGFPISRLIKRGIVAVGPKKDSSDRRHPIARCPKDIELVVAGGPGGHSQVILPWALHSEAVVRPVLLPDGRTARDIDEFRIR